MKILEIAPRIIIAMGNFFYNALLNNWSALLAVLIYFLSALGFSPLSWPILFAMIIPQIIGTITNLPVYDALKDTLNELWDAIAELMKVGIDINAIMCKYFKGEVNFDNSNEYFKWIVSVNLMFLYIFYLKIRFFLFE